MDEFLQKIGIDHLVALVAIQLTIEIQCQREINHLQTPDFGTTAASAL